MIFDKIKLYGYFNKTSPVVYEAGKSCTNGCISNKYSDMLKFISKRITDTHESIIEHTNFIIVGIIPDKYLKDLLEVVSCCTYLNVHTESICTNKKSKKISENNATLINISGSVRGYKNIYRSIKNIYNRVLLEITKLIYRNIPKEYFVDFISDEIFDENKFLSNIEFDEDSEVEISRYSFNEIDPDNMINILNIDDLSIIKAIANIPNELIIPEAIPDLLTISVQFRDMSRVSTHQLVRHRNGITQESQRYVDYSNKPIINPITFKPNQYDPNKKYKLTSNKFITYNEEGMTAQELCDALQPIYKDLKDQGMKSEDARYYMGFGASCGSVIMTFTLRHFVKFLELRLASSAQPEIRKYAKILFAYMDYISNDFSSYFINSSHNLFTTILDPEYLKTSTDKIDPDKISELYPSLEEEIT